VIRLRQDGSIIIDEIFTRNFRWEPTDYFERVRLGRAGNEHVQIAEEEVERFVERVNWHRSEPGAATRSELTIYRSSLRTCISAKPNRLVPFHRLGWRASGSSADKPIPHSASTGLASTMV